MNVPVLVSFGKVASEIEYSVEVNSGKYFPSTDYLELAWAEFQFYFFGPIYRQFVDSAVVEEFKNHLPTTIVQAVVEASRASVERIANEYSSPDDREFYHYQLERVSPDTFYLHKLEPATEDLSAMPAFQFGN